MALFAAMLSPLSAFADPATGCSRHTTLAKVLQSVLFVTVNRLGESDQEAALRDGKLLSHRRTTDPFGITVRGPFKGLPPVAEQPAAAPATTCATPAPPPLSQVAAAVNVPTLEKAIQELVIGAVNLGSHQILIGSRSIREGDLLVLESGEVSIRRLGAKRRRQRRIVLRHRFAKAYFESRLDLDQKNYQWISLGNFGYQ